MLTKTNLLPVFLILIIYYTAFNLQSQSVINWDVSWLVIAAERFLHGGNYVNNFFETNPPLILYLSLPIIFLTKWLSLDMMMSTRIYVFFIITISLTSCYLLLNKIFSDADTNIKNIIIVVLACLFALLPITDFGERDHLLLILTFPYLLLTTLRISQTKVQAGFAFFIGLLAGVGFGLKPHFLLTPILIECYYIYTQKNWRSIFKIETVALALFLIVYAATSFFIFRDYFTVMIPYVSRLYYSGFDRPLKWVILYPPALHCYFVVFLYAVLFKQLNAYRSLCTILLLAFIGFMFSFISQQDAVYYKLLPVFSITILLFVLLMIVLTTSVKISKITWFNLSVLNLMILSFILYYSSYVWTMVVLNKFIFFTYFFILFGLLFYLTQSKKNWFRISYALAITISLAYLFSNLVAGTSSWSHQFLFTYVELFLLFGFFVSEELRSKLANISIAIFVTVMFVCPVMFVSQNYYNLINNDWKLKLSSELKELKHKSVYLFSTTTLYCALSVNHANMRLASRFPFFWMLPGLLKEEHGFGTNPRLALDKKFFIDMVTDDLIMNKPELVLIDVSERKFNIRNLKLDYINYFSASERFREVWKKYQLVKTITLAPPINLSNYMSKVAIYELHDI